MVRFEYFSLVFGHVLWRFTFVSHTRLWLKIIHSCIDLVILLSIFKSLVYGLSLSGHLFCCHLFVFCHD